MNISISRLANVVNGWVTPPVEQNVGLGFALLLGVFVCLFAYVAAILLVGVDKYADKVDGEGAKMITEEDKFKFRDVLKMSGKFCLVTANCVLIYGAVFPYQ